MKFCFKTHEKPIGIQPKLHQQKLVLLMRGLAHFFCFHLRFFALILPSSRKESGVHGPEEKLEVEQYLGFEEHLKCWCKQNTCNPRQSGEHNICNPVEMPEDKLPVTFG